MIFREFFLCYCLFGLFSYSFIFGDNLASHIASKGNTYNQWFVGSVVTPNPTTVPFDHPGLELVLIGSQDYGFYDSHGNLKRIPVIWGIRRDIIKSCGF
jgi:hypothetical protein